MEQFTLHFKELDGRSSQELSRYRTLGTVESLMRTKFQEQQRLKRLKIVKKILNYLLCAVSIAFFVWIFISWAEVFTNNMTPNYAYNSWNFFARVFS